MTDKIQLATTVDNIDMGDNLDIPVQGESDSTTQSDKDKSNKKIWVIVAVLVVGVIFIVALFLFWSSQDSNLESENINTDRGSSDADLDEEASLLSEDENNEIIPNCGPPAVAEKQTPINRKEMYFCCSKGIDMQRDALKIKTCYLEDEIVADRHLIWFIFNELSGEYILEKESREENGVYCTYYFNSEGQITGRIC